MRMRTMGILRRILRSLSVLSPLKQRHGADHDAGEHHDRYDDGCDDDDADDGDLIAWGWRRE